MTDALSFNLVTAIVFVAGCFGGFVRGFTGFGFALAAVPLLCLVLPPIVAVPAVLPLELMMAVATIPRQVGHIDYPGLRWLTLGTCFGTPVGLAVLASMPVAPMRLAIGLVVVVAVLILWRRPVVAGLLRPLPLGLAGFASGLLNGGAAMSGPPVIIALLGSPLKTEAARATLMAFIAVSATLAAAIVAVKGVYELAALATTITMLPAGALAGFLGIRFFHHLPPARYRPISLSILMGIALIAVATSLLALVDHAPATLQ